VDVMRIITLYYKYLQPSLFRRPARRERELASRVVKESVVAEGIAFQRQWIVQ
jgi:hypothetical protein